MKTYEATEQAYKNGYDKGYEQGKKDANKWMTNELAIALARAKDPLPDFYRKKGRWIPVSTYEVCSHCGFEINRGERIREFFLVDNQYCCWCGADMRGEEE